MVATLQLLIFLVFMLAIFGLSVWALVDLLRRPASAFPAAGKRTKTFWGVIVGVATAIAFCSIPPPIGIAISPFFLSLLSAVAAIVYLVDVRPAVEPYTRRRPPSSGSSRGGW
ncbi:DUF2516 family protein [Cellulomonas edaphi]|uniref:DUF2516 family protein n=1 Tax=Cellulomonas edaphi TaxID=3053468 RepID=A0ABT7S2C8_9CELL|nr:DUF2516 family protein [Cellulomons edaphi]MDM7829766.1 DUF2516 family protein [Cellulomons edaphi]